MHKKDDMQNLYELIFKFEADGVFGNEFGIIPSHTWHTEKDDR